MSVIPIPELNDRARDVFRLVVESYLGTGLPVGSRTISKMASLSLSPASIRNVMQDLEELGLLAAPHTSAGRMPTETGLRLFVDGMMQAAEPSVEERRAIEAPPADVGGRERLVNVLCLSAAADAARELVTRGIAIWSHDADDRPVLIVRGQAHLIDDGTAADLDRVRQLLEQLEGKQEISRLLESALAGSATKIFIGSENKLFSLSGSSVIAAPYRGGDGRVVGVVGVIGPTRLNYARVIPMVDFTAQTLSRLMR